MAGGRRKLAAALITLLLLLIIFGPVTWLGLDLVDVPRMIYARLDTGELSIPAPFEFVKNWPLIGEPIFQFWELASSNLSAALVKVAPRPQADLAAPCSERPAVSASRFYSFLPPLSWPASCFHLARCWSKPPRRSCSAGFLSAATSSCCSPATTIGTYRKASIGVSLLQALLAGLGLIVAGVPGASLIAFGVLVLGIGFKSARR